MAAIFRRCFLVSLCLVLISRIASPLTDSIKVSEETLQREATSNVSVSPFEIVRIVNGNKKASEDEHSAKRLDLGPVWQRLGIESGQFESCAGDCSATLHRSQLDDRPQNEILVKLIRPFTFGRFLVFSEGISNKSQWVFLGYVDHDFNRYEMASHRVVGFRGQRWLVIRGEEGSGSGFSLYAETWYEVGLKGLRPVLSYPRDGHTYPWPAGLGRDFKTAVDTTDPDHLIINYEVTYTALNYRSQKSSKLFVNHHRACYIWDAAKSSFIFSHSRADISEAEIAAIANIESEQETPEAAPQIGNTKFYSAAETRAFVGGGYEVFLKYNFPGLLKIAKDKNHELTEWLRLYLKDCLDSAEKKMLERALVN